jgi:hypothetical protein
VHHQPGKQLGELAKTAILTKRNRAGDEQAKIAKNATVNKCPYPWHCNGRATDD